MHADETMPHSTPSVIWRSRWVTYPLAVGLTLLTLFVRLEIGNRLEGPVLILLTMPVLFSAFLWGVGPGLLATFTAFLGASYFLLSPINSFMVAGFTNQAQQLIMIVAGTSISFICEALHRSRRRLQSTMAATETARDELKASLKETGDLRKALDAHAIVAVTDAKGRITFINDKFCAISQYSREELIGQDHRIINSGYHPKEFIRDLWTTIGRGAVWNGEIKNRAKDGSFYWVATTIMPFLDEDGRPYQFIAIRADITERKNAEEALQSSKDDLEIKVIERTAEMQAAKERAESAARLKSEFLASMSHELRTPLNGIIGFTEFLIDGKPGPLLPKQKEYLIDVLASARHLHQLINDVLDLAKVESGKMDLHPEIFPVQKAVEEVAAVIRGIANKKRITLQIEVASALDTVTLDQHKFKQIMYNLLSNAVKFTDDGGRVGIKADRLDEGRPHEARLEIRVSDTGIGIKDEDLGRLFTEFEQLDSGAARRFQGTGLGLALTRKMVELQGGQITVQSQFGHGSTFIVVLPVNIGEKAEITE